jgi:hypothetical protein
MDLSKQAKKFIQQVTKIYKVLKDKVSSDLLD